MNPAEGQEVLFPTCAAPAAQVSGIPAGRFHPAANDAALTGDGYGSLADLLPAPQPRACEGCGRPMFLPATAPVLWACAACQPVEAA